MANAAIISEFNTRGKDISLAGTGFEYLVQTFMLDYAVARDKGKSHDQALKKMLNLVITPSQFPNNHPIYKAHGLFGKDEYALIHDDGKISAGKIIEYVHDTYDYRVVGVHHTGKQNQGKPGKLVEELTGKKSNADLVLEVSFRELYEFIGASLKYSKSVKKTGNTIKVYAPTIMNLAKPLAEIYQRAFGRECDLIKRISSYRDASLEKQRQIVAKHHKLMLSTFGERETRLYYDNSCKDRPCRYTPEYGRGGKPIAGVLSHGAVSYMRDCGKPSLRAVFDALGECNLKMKHEVCRAFYETIQGILAKGNKRSRTELYQVLLNLSGSSLPTINVAASRKKSGTFVSIFDLRNAADRYFKKNSFVVNYTGSSRMTFGPGEICIDSRTGFAGDPLTGPVNVSIRKNQLLRD